MRLPRSVSRSVISLEVGVEAGKLIVFMRAISWAYAPGSICQKCARSVPVRGTPSPLETLESVV